MNEQPVVLSPDRSTRAAHFAAQLNRYKNLLVKRWWVLVLGAGLGIGIESAIIHFTPPLFVSVGRMIVTITLKLPEGSLYTEELNNFLGTQAAMMQSDRVVSRAHQRVGVSTSNSPPPEVELKVSVSPKTSIFVLRATGTDPPYLKEFLQACMDEYIAMKKEMREQTSDNALVSLTEEVKRLQQELRKGQDEMLAFESTNSLVLLQAQGNNVDSYLGQISRQLRGLKSEYQLLQTLTLEQNLERERNKGGATVLGEDQEKQTPLQSFTYGTDAEYLKAKQQLLLLKAEKQELSEFLRPKHPKIIALGEEIDRKEKLLEIYRQQTKDQLESKKSSLALQIQNLEKDMSDWESKALETSKRMAEYQRLKLNVARVQALYDKLLGTVQTLDVNKGISQESVAIMERASAAKPKRPVVLALLLSAILGTGLGALVLMLLDRLDDRMGSLTELQDLFDQTVLGQIPKEKGAGKRGELPLLQTEDERHSFAEAYRNLRSSLLFISETNSRPRLLLVTSSIPGDGKSMTAANLAISMANSGSKVLLIDADLRKGILHTRLGIESQPGLSEVLQKANTFTEAVQTTVVANLSVLPRGRSVQNSSELFLNQDAQEFLKHVAGLYDYVIVDTPPVMAADDATTLAPHADGLIFVVRADHTSARVARAALDALYQRNARVLGVVFNAVRPTSNDYYYYKYKEYYKAYPSA